MMDQLEQQQTTTASSDRTSEVLERLLPRQNHRDFSFIPTCSHARSSPSFDEPPSRLEEWVNSESACTCLLEDALLPCLSHKVDVENRDELESQPGTRVPPLPPRPAVEGLSNVSTSTAPNRIDLETATSQSPWASEFGKRTNPSSHESQSTKYEQDHLRQHNSHELRQPLPIFAQGHSCAVTEPNVLQQSLDLSFSGNFPCSPRHLRSHTPVNTAAAFDNSAEANADRNTTQGAPVGNEHQGLKQASALASYVIPSEAQEKATFDVDVNALAASETYRLTSTNQSRSLGVAASQERSFRLPEWLDDLAAPLDMTKDQGARSPNGFVSDLRPNLQSSSSSGPASQFMSNLNGRLQKTICLNRHGTSIICHDQDHDDFHSSTVCPQTEMTMESGPPGPSTVTVTSSASNSSGSTFKVARGGPSSRRRKGALGKISNFTHTIEHSGALLHTMRYNCPFPGCSKTFSTSGHSRRHSAVHMDLHPFHCPHKGCKKEFSRRDNCTQHQCTHHTSQLFAFRSPTQRRES